MSVQLAMLGFLQDRDYHGYELKKTLEHKMGMWANFKFGSIYHALSNLEKSGYVRAVRTDQKKGKPARSVYAITLSGREEFRRLLTDNITALKMVYLEEDIGVYFGERLERRDFGEVLLKRIELYRELLDKLRHHREHMVDYSPESLKTAWLLITRHIRLLEVDLDWFENMHRELAAGRLFEESAVEKPVNSAP